MMVRVGINHSKINAVCFSGYYMVSYPVISLSYCLTIPTQWWLIPFTQIVRIRFVGWSNWIKNKPFYPITEEIYGYIL